MGDTDTIILHVALCSRKKQTYISDIKTQAELSQAGHVEGLKKGINTASLLEKCLNTM